MKNLKQKIIFCAAIILAVLLAACSSPFNAPPAGAGNVIIRIAVGNGRTILPEAVTFSRYALTVAKKGGSNLPVPSDLSGITGSGISITLDEGEYTVTVKAYQSIGGKDYLAAQGSKTVTINSDSTETAVVIELKPLDLLNGGNGFFSYDITLPNASYEPYTAVLNLKSSLWGYDEEFDLKDSAASSAPIRLDAGYYELFISLTKENLKAGEYAAVHIYSGMETKAVLDMSNGFATINLDTLQKVIDDVTKELARVDSGDIKISTNGSDVMLGTLWVTQSAVTALRTALTTAQGVIDNPPEKQSPVNAARQNLEMALTTFRSNAKQGAKFENATWTGLLTEVATPATITTGNNNSCTISIPLAGYTNSTGAYSVADGKVSFSAGGGVLATATVEGNNLILSFPKPVLGLSAATLTKGTPSSPKSDIESLYSGIWSNTGTQPALTYISAENWTFSLPSDSGKKGSGKIIRVYDRKAAFVKPDGTVFAVAKVATEKAELTGNTLTVYPVSGGSHALTLTPFPNPFVGNWQGGSTIGGTLYAGITTWTLENASGAVLVSGEYVWNGSEAYFLGTNGVRFATGTINSAKNSVTVVVNNPASSFTAGQSQAFTLITSPFIGTWKATIAVVATVTAKVTTNTFDISANVTDLKVTDQFTWRTVNGVRKGNFYLNGYSYGVGELNSAGTEIKVTLDEPLDAPVVGVIQTLTLKK
jgi:hypothetical protein